LGRPRWGLLPDRRDVPVAAGSVARLLAGCYDELLAARPTSAEAITGPVAECALLVRAIDGTGAERLLDRLAGAGGSSAAEAARVAGRWMRASDDREQWTALAALQGLARSAPQDDGVAVAAMWMYRKRARSVPLREAAADLLLHSLKGRAADQFARDVRYLLPLQQLEGHPLVVAGSVAGGGSVSTAAWSGKVVLINFWATWCAPCRDEIPEIAALVRRYRGEGLEVLGVNCDADSNKLTAFLQSVPGMTWPQLLNGSLESDGPAAQCRVRVLPALLLVDRRGIVRSVTARDDLEGRVSELLGEPFPSSVQAPFNEVEP
jgi:thiol-disulfide isomerase/thioredoxin